MCIYIYVEHFVSCLAIARKAGVQDFFWTPCLTYLVMCFHLSFPLQEQLAQNVRGDLTKQSRVLEEEEEIHLRKELDESREQLKQLKSELLRKEYKHDTEMVRGSAYL